MTELRVLTCNAKKELAPATVRRLVATVCLYADVILWQEVETEAHRAAVRSLTSRGWVTYWPGGAANSVPISYKASKVRRRIAAHKKMAHKGQAGVTPARFVVDVVLELTTGERFALVNSHKISKAFTERRDRRARWDKAARLEARRVLLLALRYGAVIGGGDQNRSRWAPRGTTGHWPKHGTYGRAFYDVLYTAGKARLARGSVRTISTPSDHNAVAGVFTRR